MATAAPKKMTMIQLTVVVAVNMMGSGIIMLPTNMAQVGAISLLSWIVTALGSMAIAYGFAQAGVFNQRPGGMAAYAEDAYGKDGYFLTFLLYFFSLAIGNVAIAISAVGYLAGFFPGLSATPIATCISVIGLIWLTTVSNFGGPSVTGRIGAITVWGVIIPVAGLSIIGWFWFRGDVFAQAWNPQGMPLLEGMGSSIALTLWAFLGMESAAQNSDAVENPKKNVPLACMFGTLGAAAVYVLSTTVIQGIVPNAELANSTGPFALAYAKMFNPTIGSIIMALAVFACLGSLLGWQFTIAQTAKSAAADRLFPAIFAKENRMGAPIAGMVIMGIVQTAMALSTISPTLSEQFSALVNLAVVTNVIPYIISLSALMVMMKNAGVADAVYKRNVAIAVFAMLYATYAIVASGQEAVLGGTVVLALTFVIYGFLAPRFMGESGKGGGESGKGNVARSPAAIAVAAVALALAAGVAPSPAEAAAWDRIQQSGKITLGYRPDAQPLSYRDESGKPSGYAVALCERVAESVKSELGARALEVQWVPVAMEDRFEAVRSGRIDLLCVTDGVTLAGRREVDFSIPIFPAGIGAMLRADAPRGLRNVLEGNRWLRPFWRATPAEILEQQKFAVVAGSAGESWLSRRRADLRVDATVVPVESYDAGVRAVLDRSADVFFAERSILLDAAARSPSAGELRVLERRFSYAPLAMAMPRGEQELRLLVDATLSRVYTSDEFAEFYTQWFGKPDEDTLKFFEWMAIQE